MKLPSRLRKEGISFVLIKPKDKRPFEKEWTQKPYSHNDKKLLDHIESGGNYGVIGGYSNLFIIDFDDVEIQKKIAPLLPKTFSIKTGGGGLHLYYFSKTTPKSYKIKDSEKTLIDIQGEGKMVVGPGSIHPNGNEYKIVEDCEIASFDINSLKSLLTSELRRDFLPNEWFLSEEVSASNNVVDLIKSVVKIEDIIDVKNNPMKCPFHTDNNPSFSVFNNGTSWNCFAGCGGGDVIKLYEKKNNVSFKTAIKRLQKEFKIGVQKQEIKFEYDYHEPQTQIKTISELKRIITKNFPSIWFETTACLATTATMCLKNLNGCPSLNLIGNPSGEKTTILSFFYGQEHTYLSDDFTPRAFVSHSANVKKEDLESVDLLPKLKNKILITPELAPLFEAPKEKLIDNFATLTRVLDGEGLNRDSGVHGHRGYPGEYKFAWIGASTPLRHSVWNIMGKIGNRLFFLNMKEKQRTSNDYLTMFTGKAYEEKVKECRGVVRNFLDNLFKENGIRSLEWDNEQDILLLPEIIKHAQFLAKLRASLMVWKGNEAGQYEYSFPIVEEPPRAINALYNIAKGHALINGRTYLKEEDLEIVKAICLSSMPHDRFKFLQLLSNHDGRLTTKQIEKELGCSTMHATRIMKTFEALKIVTIKSIHIEEQGIGRPMQFVEIKEEFKKLLPHTQGSNDVINAKSHKKNSCVSPFFTEEVIEDV